MKRRELICAAIALPLPILSACSSSTSKLYTGLFVAETSIIDLPDRMSFPQPGIADLHYPNGESHTATFKSQNDGILIEVQFAKYYAAPASDDKIKISRDGRDYIYSRSK